MSELIEEVGKVAQDNWISYSILGSVLFYYFIKQRRKIQLFKEGKKKNPK